VGDCDGELHTPNRTSDLCQQSRFVFCSVVAISTADSNKWLLLIENRLDRQTPKVHTSSDYQLLGPIRQRQRRLTEAQAIEMAARYQVGATVYELAAEFGCHRATIAVRLKKVGIAMRRQSPTSESIDAIVRLYASELSATGGRHATRILCKHGAYVSAEPPS
jgi:hypothetical protein